MKRFEPERAVSPAEVALDAMQELLPLPGATAEAVDRVGNVVFSEGVHEYTFYDYFVYGINLNSAILPGALNPDLRFFSFKELQEAINVSESTKLIATSLVEDRKVAVAVITRSVGGRTEFLLVHNSSQQYFFPSIRLKTHLLPAEAAIAAVRNDLGYDGSVDVVDQAEVQVSQESQRFGRRTVSFYFHCCAIALPGVDCATPGNLLEKSLALQASRVRINTPVATAPYDEWFDEEQLRSRNDLSPSVASILGTLLQLAERSK
jgi:hypothetical protein